MTQGLVLYKGPSSIDGNEIVVIALPGGAGTKTGPVVNTYILRANMPPGVAVRTGQDSTICGNCPHRGKADPEWVHPSRKTKGRAWGRTCYVHIPRAPTVVWNSWKAGKYPGFTGLKFQSLLRGQHIRIGTYGDPAAVPFASWLACTSRAESWTGFTHLWRGLDAKAWGFIMASVDSPAERDEAIMAGWRTYRVKVPGAPMLSGERVCPGSHEAGQKTICSVCRLCNGLRRVPGSQDIVIDRHGTNERFSGERNEPEKI